MDTIPKVRQLILTAKIADYTVKERFLVGGMKMNSRLRILALALCSVLAGTTPALSAQTFENPLFAGADPRILFVNNIYYYTQSQCTTPTSVCIKESSTLTGLASAGWNVVWTAPATGPNSADLWAPTLRYINSTWYIYYTADDCAGDTSMHRIFVIQGPTSSSPLGIYAMGSTGLMNGQLPDSLGVYSIDPDEFTASDGNNYLAYTCGLPTENLCLAQMSDPLHLAGNSVQISTPTQNWETRSGYSLQEGSQGFVSNGVNYISYSASGSYSVGMLVNTMQPQDSGTNPLLVPGAWHKEGPIFDGHDVAYGTGSVVFMPTLDGKATWMIYHGDDSLSCPPNSCRSIRMQKAFWDLNGSPVLGYPVDRYVYLTDPSGEGGVVDSIGSNLNSSLANWGWGNAYGDAAEGDTVDGLITPGAFTATNSTSIQGTTLTAGVQEAFAALNPNAQSYVITTDVQLGTIGNSNVDQYQKYGIRAAWADHKNYYEVWLDPKGTGVVATYPAIGGNPGTDTNGNSGWENCAVPNGFVFTNTNRLQVFVNQVATNETAYSIWLNGIPVSGPCQNRTFTTSLDEGQPSGHGSDGQVGVSTENVTATYTNFTVTTPDPLDGATYHLYNKASQLCLDNDDVTGGGPIIQWWCSAASTQTWTLHAKGMGYFSLQSQKSGYCLADPGSNPTDGTLLTQVACSSDPSQYWLLIPEGDGTYNLENQGATTNAGHAMMLDNPGALTQNDIQMQIWHQDYTPFDWGPAQEWVLEMN